jgi:small nuclear ribonucleoprotein E
MYSFELVYFLGFDEYMNLVLDDACEVHMKKNTSKPLKRIMLKGDNITCIQAKDGAK